MGFPSALRFAFVLVLLTLYACDFKRQSNVELGNAKGILFIANGDDPAVLDPQLATGLSERNVLQALFEGLVGINPVNGAPVPGVAEEWELLADKTTWIFYLNKQARWSNGDEIGAKDFVYAWQRMLEPANATSYAYMLYPIENAQAYNKGELHDFSGVGVKARDDHTLEIQLERPTPWFLQLLNHPSYYPVHRNTIENFKVENPELSLWTRPGNMVSNGPFILEEWLINSKLKVVKNPYYWDAQAVQLKSIVFQSISDKNVEELAFRSQQVHLTNTPRMAIEKLAAYRQENPELLISTPIYASIYFAFNTTRKPFDNTKVRKALALAIDREALVNQVTKGGEIPNYSFLPTNPNGYKPKPHFSFDRDKARKLLKEAGYPNGKNFPAFKIEIVNGEANLKLAIAIQEMWRKNLNIDMEIHGHEWKSWLQTRAVRDFDISTGSWYADFIDASNFFDVLRSDSGNNHTGWQNADYDQNLNFAAESLNDTARFIYFEKANAILMNDMPVIPLFQPTNNNLVHESVTGFIPDQTGSLRYQNISLKIK